MSNYVVELSWSSWCTPLLLNAGFSIFALSRGEYIQSIALWLDFPRLARFKNTAKDALIQEISVGYISNTETLISITSRTDLQKSLLPLGKNYPITIDPPINILEEHEHGLVFLRANMYELVPFIFSTLISLEPVDDILKAELSSAFNIVWGDQEDEDFISQCIIG